MKPLNFLSTLAVAGVLTAGSLANPAPAAAQSIKCGKSYKVVRGDSLSGIAQRAYQNRASFQLVYSVNSGTIGPDPSFVQEGSILKIPCLDEVTPSTAKTATIRQVSTTKALPPPAPRQIRFVVGSDWAPFTNEDQAQGGMMTEVTNVAMSLAASKPKYKILHQRLGSPPATSNHRPRL